MNFLNNNLANDETGQYATTNNFCHLFKEDVSDLYQLSLLLTADHAKADQCFVAGLGDCVMANKLFKQWAHSWAKRTIVQEAIRTLQPHPDHAVSITASVFAKSELTTARDEDVELDRVLSLREFERFVFVMSVLEHYNEDTCTRLLGCSLQDIREARVRALEHVLGSHGASSLPDRVADLQETNR
jgi:hypothetical protein